MCLFKKHTATEPPVIFNIKFTANGTIVQWTGSDINANASLHPTSPGPHGTDGYELSTSYGPFTQLTVLGLFIPTTTLAVGTYSDVNNITIPFTYANYYELNGLTVSYGTSAGDSARVIISSIHNGYANGFFTAKLSGGGNVIMTNGEFNNIHIIP